MSQAEQLITDNLDVWTSAIQNKASTGRGSSKKQELYGLKKLRELILELAVRGLLVPQDPNDEPASVLLEKVATEKELLIKKGEIKKQKSPPQVSQADNLFELPKGWKWARFPDVCSYGPGKTPSTKNSLFWGDGEDDFNWVSIADMGHYGEVQNTAKKITPKAAEEVFKGSPVKAGTLLMSFKLTVGKVSKLGVDAYHNEAIISVFPYSGIDQDYIFRFLPERALSGNAKKAIKGNTLNSDSLARICIPIPPEAEQPRIVAKVDELMALCDQLEQQTESSLNAHQTLVETLLKALLDAAQSRDDASAFEQAWQRIAEHFDVLFTSEHSIDQLKQTILQLAVMGKLVPQDPNDEPASVLLEKIAVEKERLVKEGKIKKQKKLPPISDEEKPFELPVGWEWCKFGLLAEFINGDRGKNYPNKSEYVDSGIPWINTGHIEPDGTLTKSDMNFITQQKFDSLRSGKIQDGDLVYCLRGATFGKTAFVEPYTEGAIASSLMIIRPFIRALGPFFYRYLVSSFGRSQIFRFDNGSAQPNLSANSVMLYAFPCPPLSEQHRIVDKLAELFRFCDSLRDSIQESQTTQFHLADAMAEQALS